MLIPIDLFLFVAFRDFLLAHRDLGISVGSWVAVETNGTRLPSLGGRGALRISSMRLRLTMIMLINLTFSHQL